MGLALVVVSRGFSLVVACGLLIAVAALAAEPRLQGTPARQLWHAAQQLQFPGSGAQAQ